MAPVNESINVSAYQSTNQSKNERTQVSIIRRLSAIEDSTVGWIKVSVNHRANDCTGDGCANQFVDAWMYS